MKKPLPPAKKTTSYLAYKRALRWQIIIPMIVITLLFVAASIATAMRESGIVSQWADVSTVWLLIPVLIFAIVNILILGGLIYGLAKLIDITPTGTQKLQGYIRLIGKKIKTLADSAAKPIFKIEGFSASLRRIFRQK